MGLLRLINFESVAELTCYITALMCGVSTLLPINAIFSAPGYIVKYYKFVTGDYNRVPSYPNFWDNAMTYYDLCILVVSLFLEPMTLTRIFRRFPMRARMMVALALLWLEIFILMIVPVIKWTETGAVATIVIAGVFSGCGKSILDSTVYGMFCIFPARFMSAAMAGMGISGVLTSTIQIILKKALPDDDDGARVQSQIFYGLMVGIQGVTLFLMFILRWNPFAKPYLKALGSGDLDKKDQESLDQVEPPQAESSIGEENGELRSEVPNKVATVDEEAGYLVNTNLWYTLKAAFPMLLACSMNFLVTLFLFPTIVVTADLDDYWFATIVVFIFNVFDTVGRFLPTFRALWLPRQWTLIGSFARIVFVPLLILSSFRKIPQHAFTYLMMVIFGFSNGYIGGLCLVQGPTSKGLTTSGHRFVAGAMLGMSILVGGSIGTGFSLLMQGLRKDLKKDDPEVILALFR